MPLDPALADLLDTMAASASYVRPADTNLAGARQSHEADASRFTPPGQRAAVADVRDTHVATPAGPRPIRIYRPLSSATPLPTIVWYHGGGWTTGSLETGDIVARSLSSGTPAVVVSVAYRLSPEHPWPAATEDAAAALQWAAAHIGELGGDPVRIAIGGDSAGGNIAAVAAQLARDGGPRLAAQILLYPVLDLDMDRSDRYPHYAITRTATTSPATSCAGACATTSQLARTRPTPGSPRHCTQTSPACPRPSSPSPSTTRSATRAPPTLAPLGPRPSR
jgi:acetyl esterase